MPSAAASILSYLEAVDAERAVRAAQPGLGAKVVALKEFQQRRFSHTYADLLTTARYGGAARFFLDDLYGPADFTQRDAQFARVVPTLERIFPMELVATVAALAELHALSEALDTAMATELDTQILTASGYVGAWQRTGRHRDRGNQIALTLDIATRLDRLTRKPLVGGSLRLMRAPAQAAGLAQLQQFLERGFETFRAMKGAEDFIETVSMREQALATALFAAETSGPSANVSKRVAMAALPRDP